MATRKRQSLVSVVASHREAVGRIAAEVAAMKPGNAGWHAAQGRLYGARSELAAAEAKLQEHRKRDAQRKLKDRTEGRVKARPRRPARTPEQEVERFRKSVETRKAKVAALPEGSPEWHRARHGLEITERALERKEAIAALLRESGADAKTY